MNRFQCERCGACCKPGWLVNKNAGRPHTRGEKLKSFITRKPLPSRVYYVTYTQWLTEDIERAATFLGITFREFIETYELNDDIANFAEMQGMTREQLLKKEADSRGVSVEELINTGTKYRSYQLFTAIKNEKRDCPFVECDENGIYSCSIYEARPKMCQDYPSKNQLQDRFDFYEPHCPGFKKE